MMAENICKSTLWDHIAGWEVVVALLIVAVYATTVAVARGYFLWKAASNCPHHHQAEDHE